VAIVLDVLDWSATLSTFPRSIRPQALRVGRPIVPGHLDAVHILLDRTFRFFDRCGAGPFEQPITHLLA